MFNLDCQNSTNEKLLLSREFKVNFFVQVTTAGLKIVLNVPFNARLNGPYSVSNLKLTWMTSPKSAGKNGSLNICSSRRTEQTPSSDEDYVI